MTADLVVVADDGLPTTTSLVIAEGTDNEHASVLRLIRDNVSDFEEFGRVGFEIDTFDTAGGPQQREVVALNEEQATLLLTYMRNSVVVKDFKKRLVRAFYDMKRMEMSDDMVIHRALTLSVERVQRLKAELEVAAPKAAFYDKFLDADGTYAVGAVAKMLKLSQNKLFEELRNRGVLISKGSMRNTPYQRYMHHFRVIPHDFERADGSSGTSYTTKVQPSGIAFIASKLGQPILREVTG